VSIVNWRKQKATTTWLLMWIVLLIVKATASAQQPSTKLTLDRETFSPAGYAALQELAHQVAATIDQLIPGQVSEFVHGDILCFQVTTKTLGKATDAPSPPVTISNDYKLSYEPTASVAGRTRIALFEVEPLYTTSYRARFVYQLSHELAHVKMGVRIDNSLIETLAIAVSHEVLVRQGMIAYANSEFNEQMHRLPDEVQRAYAAGSLTEPQRYWQVVLPTRDCFYNNCVRP
jgi:hypothetical protein